MERALVTGVTGFVGGHLARGLVADGVEVHAVVRRGARLDRVPDLVDRVDLHVDAGGTSLVEAVEQARPDAVFHLATTFIATHEPGDVDALVHDNITFPTRLIEAIVRSSTPVPFVNVGTAWQHVGGQRYRPKNLYAATKQAFEDVLTHYVVSSSVPAVTVNLFDTYGPADHRGKLVQALIAAARSGEPLPMSSGTQLIDLVEVTDVVRALRLAAAQAGGPMPVFAASSGSPRSLRDLVEVLDDVLPAPVPVLWGARPDRDGEMLEPWDAGPPVPGWAPQVSLREGLRLLLERSGGTPGPP